MGIPENSAELRKGWTTGACATAATKAAALVLFGGLDFPETVAITLPKGEAPVFPLALTERGVTDGQDWVRVGIVKDAGDDPDVTHGATIVVTLYRGTPGSGIVFRAGPGVGTVTKPGLPLGVGEPAINPVPRRLMGDEILACCEIYRAAPDVIIEIAVPDGEKLAQKTWNPRLGILGGLSILGTTGVVVPYSCSAWIHSIQRGIDVARATGLTHVAGCTGHSSEQAVIRHYGLDPAAIIDMGDFVGGMLKYLRRHPIPRLTIAGGFAKLSKLAQGARDLHSARSTIDRAWLARQLSDLGADVALTDRAAAANTALEILTMADGAGLALGDRIATLAHRTVREILDEAPIAVDILVFDRTGNRVGGAGPFFDVTAP